MRILVLNHEYPPLAGGAGGAARNLAAEFVAAGHRVCVLTSAHGNLPDRETRDGIDIRRIGALRSRLDRGGLAHVAAFAVHGALRVPALAREFSPDVALAFFGVPAGVVALWLRRRMGIPYVVSLRGGDVPGQQPEQLGAMHALCGPVLRRVWSEALAVAANGPGLAAAARRFMPAAEIVETAGGVDAGVFHPADASGAARGAAPLRLLFAGRVNREKGLDDLLAALARVRGAWTLTVAGDGPELAPARAQARRLGIADRVEYLGFVPRGAMPDAYRRADVLVQPSRYEGLPNSILEAMASGLAVVATDTPGSASLVGAGRTGLLVPRGDVGALADALGLLAGDGDRVAAMGEAGRREVRERNSWPMVAQQYLRLLGAPGAAPR